VAYVESTVNHAPSPGYDLGDASSWASNANAHGVQVDASPARGAAAQWNANAGGMGASGHAAYVESISADGSITVSEDAFPSGPFRWRTISPGTSDWPSNFIHFKDLDVGSRVGVFRPSTATFYLRNSNTSGSADVTADYGATGDTPVVGDWDGNRTTTVGVYRSSTHTFYLRNSNTGGSANATAIYGIAGDIPVVGDWDGA
jgi:surface antigen